MIEYPHILSSSKAPRENCIAFQKIDGSNIRIKYTQKRGFHLFGSRTQLIDATHPHLGAVVDIFNNQFNEPLTKIVKDNWPNEREVIVYGEFYGLQSFAGMHVPEDPKFFVLFDVLVGHKNRKFVNPKEFIKLFGHLRIPAIIYDGNLNDQFIQDVREDKYCLNEGVVCKGTSPSGAFRGGMWMCKIKTQQYLDRLKAKFGEEGVKKYGE